MVLLGFAFIGLVNGLILGMMIGAYIGHRHIVRQQRQIEQAEHELIERLRNDYNRKPAA